MTILETIIKFCISGLEKDSITFNRYLFRTTPFDYLNSKGVDSSIIEKINTKEKIFKILLENNLIQVKKSNDKCSKEGCENKTSFFNLKQGYRTYCSRECGGSSKESLEKAKQTCIRKFGVENYSKTKEFSELSKKKDYSIISSKLKELWKNKDFKDRVIKKGINTRIKNNKLTTNKNFFENNPNSKHIKNFKEWKSDSFIIQNFSKNGSFNLEDVYKMMKYFNSSKNGTYSRLKKSGLKCIHSNGTSIFEKEIQELIKNRFKGLKVIFNDRKTIINPRSGRFLELDVFIPKLKIGFEINGGYWHQNILKEMKKFYLSKEKDIELFFIYDKSEVEDILKGLEYVDNISCVGVKYE